MYCRFSTLMLRQLRPPWRLPKSAQKLERRAATHVRHTALTVSSHITAVTMLHTGDPARCRLHMRGQGDADGGSGIDGSEWVSFDDKTVRAVGDWDNVVEKVDGGLLMPQLLFFGKHDPAQRDERDGALERTKRAGAELSHRARAEAEAAAEAARLAAEEQARAEAEAVAQKPPIDRSTDRSISLSPSSLSLAHPTRTPKRQKERMISPPSIPGGPREDEDGAVCVCDVCVSRGVRRTSGGPTTHPSILVLLFVSLSFSTPPPPPPHHHSTLRLRDVCWGVTRNCLSHRYTPIAVAVARRPSSRACRSRSRCCRHDAP